jgi:tRNA threonylcarbamoyladenosine biosynthesis protein TsaE
VVFLSSSQSETEKFGRSLGMLLEEGTFIALYGDLGGGKTCFVRGVVDGINPDSVRLVASPTFAVMNEYPGKTPIYHFDLYRLSCGSEIAELGFDDYFYGNGICIVEWAERLGETLPGNHLSIQFEYIDEDVRSICLEAHGRAAHNLLEQMESQLKGS